MREHARGWHNVLHSASYPRHPSLDGTACRRGPGLSSRPAITLRRTLAACLLGLSASCARWRPQPAGPPPAGRAWPPTLALAQAYAGRGEFGTADSALSAFAARYPGTSEALESSYWRAVFKLDPSNRDLSIETAIMSLDGYLADTRPHQHTAEAKTLRRIAGELDRLNRLAGNALAQQIRDANAPPATRPGVSDSRPEPAKPAADSAAQDEIKRLKDELAKANAELERIRRRLTQPPGKPPA